MARENITIIYVNSVLSIPFHSITSPSSLHIQYERFKGTCSARQGIQPDY